MTNKTKLRKANVLAVDDYEANLVALEAVLGGDYNLILARSGPEAISILHLRTDVDVVLLDVQMPDMDGFETAAQIKKISGYADLPIIFITAVYREDPFIKKGYAVGAVDYFSKPFDPEILKLKVSVYAAFRQKANVLKQQERQIRETEELLRTGRKLSSVLESLPVGVLISDVAGRICQVNNQVSHICKSIGSSGPDAYGEAFGWWDSDGKKLKETDGPLARALRKGETTHNHEINLTCKGEPSKTIVSSASPLLGLDGHIVGAVIIIQDVTESREIEDALEQRITKLVSLGVELEESLSH
jgi:CheY-like chemotaxis protein